MKFYIALEYCKSVSHVKRWMSERYEKMTPEERVLSAIKGENHHCSSMWSEDHPEFTKLREQLGRDGYIHIQRGWWNGDSVLKPFTVNGKQFRPHDQFPSASPMKHTLKTK